MAQSLVGIKYRALDSNGNPLALGTLETYAPSTSTPKATYTDQAAGTANSTTVSLDANGEANIWLKGAYKFILKDSAGVVQNTIDSFNLTNEFVTLKSESGSAGAASSTGTVQYKSADTIKIRNNADGADLNLLSKDTSDIFRVGDSGGVQIGNSGGSAIKQIRKFSSVAVDPGSIAATTRGSIAVTVSGSPGIAAGDTIIAQKGWASIADDLIFEGVEATAANQVTWYFYNPTGAPIDDGSVNWDILWIDVT